MFLRVNVCDVKPTDTTRVTYAACICLQIKFENSNENENEDYDSINNINSSKESQMQKKVESSPLKAVYDESNYPKYFPSEENVSDTRVAARPVLT